MLEVFDSITDWVFQVDGIQFAGRWVVFCFGLFCFWTAAIAVGKLAWRALIWYLKFLGVLKNPDRYPVAYYQPRVVPPSKPKEEKVAEDEPTIIGLAQVVPEPDIVEEPTEELYDEYTNDSPDLVPTMVPSDDEADVVSIRDLQPLPPRIPRPV
jgi:hypothetical protein